MRSILQLPTFLPLIPFTYPEETGAFDVNFSPDSTLVAAAHDDNTAKLFRLSEGTLLRELSGHSKPVTAVGFSPDGILLATAAADGDARIWRVEDGELVRTIRGGGGSTTAFDTFFGESIGRLRFSADGKSLLTSSNGTLRFWSVADGRLLLSYPNLEVRSFAVSPNGKHFAYGTDAINGTNAAVVLARWPLLITGARLRANELQLDWQGAGDAYEVQHRANLNTGAWEVIAGPFTNTNLSVPATNRGGFLRVRGLPDN